MVADEHTPCYRVYTPADITSRADFLQQRAASISRKRKREPAEHIGKQNNLNLIYMNDVTLIFYLNLSIFHILQL